MVVDAGTSGARRAADAVAARTCPAKGIHLPPPVGRAPLDRRARYTSPDVRRCRPDPAIVTPGWIAPPVPEQEPQATNTPTDETISSDAQETPDTTEAPPAGNPALGDTVGTGSVIAFGCIAGTVFLIVLGLIYLLAVQVFG
jgi:hypothetical protein